MAILSLSQATNYISDITLASGVSLPTSESGSLTGKTGLTFPNVPAGHVLLRVVIGASGAGNLTVVGMNTAPNKVIAVSNSTVYIFGPFDTALYSDGAGLVHVNFSVVTGNTAGVYLVPELMPVGAPAYPTYYRPVHNPFQTNEGAPDW